jgi:kynureninase
MAIGAAVSYVRAMTWTRWRDEFPILERRTYLNSCSLGALSRRSVQRLARFQEDWHNHGAAAWYEIWLGRIDELRGRVARMLGAGDDELALAASVSAALSVIASALDYRQRPRVVCAELDFPTIAYQWRVRPDVELVLVPSDDGATIDLQRWADAVDGRTAAIATSHVFFATGAIQDLRALAAIARKAGALFIVDAYQSAGQIPLGLRDDDVDVLVTGPLKWLMGGPGLAYTAVRREIASDLHPTITGWFGAADQFDFDTTRHAFKEDARRLELGTPAVPTVHTALGGQEIVDEIGVPAIRQRNRELTEHLVEQARNAGFSIRAAPDPDARSAIVTVAADDPAGAVRHLERAGIIVDARPGHVRVSPHFYNTPEELDRAVDELVAWRDR